MPCSGFSLQHQPLRSASDAPRGPGSGLAAHPSLSRLPRTALGHWAAWTGGRLLRLTHVPRASRVRGPTFRVWAFPDFSALSPSELLGPGAAPATGPLGNWDSSVLRAFDSSAGMVPPAPVPQWCIQLSEPMESRWMPWRLRRLRVLPPGFRVPWVHPSPPRPARGLTDPGPCTGCSSPIRVIRAALWSLRVHQPAPLRARPATGHLIALPSPGLHASVSSLRSGCRRPVPAGRGPSHHVLTGTSFGTPDRARDV